MRRRFVSVLLAGLLHSALISAAADERPQLALVIDDLGWDLRVGKRVLALPGSITVAVLPGTPAGSELARRAHAHGIEVMLHQPMAAETGVDAGPGYLQPGMPPSELASRLRTNLAEIPHHRGVSNHMGSLATRCENTMAVVMSELADRGLYFLDSRTTPRSVAYSSARDALIPATRRDVFIDNVLDTQTIERALESAVRLAEQRGHAVAIGHPHAVTLAVLESKLPSIMERVELVPVSALTGPPTLTATRSRSERSATAAMPVSSSAAP